MPRQFIFLLCGVLNFSAFAIYNILTSNFRASTFFFLFLHFSHKKEAGLEALTPKPTLIFKYIAYFNKLIISTSVGIAFSAPLRVVVIDAAAFAKRSISVRLLNPFSST